MRIHQARALLKAASKLEDAGLGIELFPFDAALPGHADDYGDDYMTGSCEYEPPEEKGARIYNIDLVPGPHPMEVTARVKTGYSDEGYLLLDEQFSVAPPDEDGETFNEQAPEQIAGRVVDVIREHEKTVENPFMEITRGLESRPEN